MHSRWFNAAVIFLWVSAMGWLLKEKVLPPLLVGHPPSYASILKAQRRDPLVGWRMRFNDRPLGWALSSVAELEDEMTEVRSRVHFRELPLKDLTRGWLRVLAPSVDREVSGLSMDAKNTTLIDPLGRLSGFRSEVRVNPLDDLITMEGTIEGSHLKLEIHIRGLPDEQEVHIPQNALLSDALSPRTQLPGIRPGQTWTVPVYSPLRPASQPLEILQATVERWEPIVWNGLTLEALLVVYRGLSSDERPRGKLWVHEDGTVLKQQVMIFDSSMTFVRLPDDQAAELAAKVGLTEGQSGRP